MRIAVISDVHGDIKNLERILEQIAKERVDEIYCLGDIGDNGNSSESIGIIKQVTKATVLGNHDKKLLQNCQRAKLTDDALSYVEKLEYTHVTNVPEGRRIYLAHAELVHAPNFTYIFPDERSLNDIAQNLGTLDERDILFVGHTHVQGMSYSTGGRIQFIRPTEDSSVILSKKPVIVNVGAVLNEPKKRPGYVIYQTPDQIEFHYL